MEIKDLKEENVEEIKKMLEETNSKLQTIHYINKKYNLGLKNSYNIVNEIIEEFNIKL